MNEEEKMLIEKMLAQYGTWMLRKKQICQVLNISPRTLDTAIAQNDYIRIPEYTRDGNLYLWPITTVVRFLIQKSGSIE